MRTAVQRIDALGYTVDMDHTTFASRGDVRALEAEALGVVHLDLDDVSERPHLGPDSVDDLERFASNR